jgi:hypothetical protein
VGVFEVDWGSVSVIGGLVAASFGYLSRQIHRLEDKLFAEMGGLDTRLGSRMDRLEDKLDKLTERYIEHLERRH